MGEPSVDPTQHRCHVCGAKIRLQTFFPVRDADHRVRLVLCKSCARPAGLDVPQDDPPTAIAMLLGLRKPVNADALAERLSALLPDLPWDIIRQEADLHRGTFRMRQRRSREIRAAVTGTDGLIDLACEAAKDKNRLADLYAAVASLFDSGDDITVFETLDALKSSGRQDGADQLQDMIDETATTPTDITMDSRTGAPYTIYGISFVAAIFIPESAEANAFASATTVTYDSTAAAQASRASLALGAGPAVLVDNRLFTAESAWDATPSQVRRFLRTLAANLAKQPDAVTPPESPFPNVARKDEDATVNLFIRVGVGAIMAEDSECDAVNRALFGPADSADERELDTWHETLKRWATALGSAVAAGLVRSAASAHVIVWPELVSPLEAGDTALEVSEHLGFRVEIAMYERAHPGPHPELVAVTKDLGDTIEFSITDPAGHIPPFQHTFHTVGFADPNDEISDLVVDACKRLGITALHVPDEHNRGPGMVGLRRRRTDR